MKITDLRNPYVSYKRPLTEGPKKAPNANVDVHKPDTKPYVSIVFGDPLHLKNGDKLISN